jgi:outer membrane protein assembly factor BamE (lipoprotein component of BamABCDE complex)
MMMSDEARTTSAEIVTVICRNRRGEPLLQHRRFNGAAVRFCLVLFAILSLAACSDKRITKANVDQVSENMSKKQVESILGPPTEIDNRDLQMKKTTYLYRQGKDTVSIVFKEDKVVEKQTSLSE